MLTRTSTEVLLALSCDSRDESTCRVTISEREHAIVHAIAALKGEDVAALKSYVQAHNDGKSYSAYVAGWRVEIIANNEDSYSSSRISISYETFYV